jgi:hypothetical protein
VSCNFCTVWVIQCMSSRCSKHARIETCSGRVCGAHCFGLAQRERRDADNVDQSAGDVGHQRGKDRLGSVECCIDQVCTADQAGSVPCALTN